MGFSGFHTTILVGGELAARDMEGMGTMQVLRVKIKKTFFLLTQFTMISHPCWPTLTSVFVDSIYAGTSVTTGIGITFIDIWNEYANVNMNMQISLYKLN